MINLEIIYRIIVRSDRFRNVCMCFGDFGVFGFLFTILYKMMISLSCYLYEFLYTAIPIRFHNFEIDDLVSEWFKVF